MMKIESTANLYTTTNNKLKIPIVHTGEVRTVITIDSYEPRYRELVNLAFEIQGEIQEAEKKDKQ